MGNSNPTNTDTNDDVFDILTILWSNKWIIITFTFLFTSIPLFLLKNTEIKYSINIELNPANEHFFSKFNILNNYLGNYPLPKKILLEEGYVESYFEITPDYIFEQFPIHYNDLSKKLNSFNNENLNNIFDNNPKKIINFTNNYKVERARNYNNDFFLRLIHTHTDLDSLKSLSHDLINETLLILKASIIYNLKNIYDYQLHKFNLEISNLNSRIEFQKILSSENQIILDEEYYTIIKQIQFFENEIDNLSKYYLLIEKLDKEDASNWVNYDLDRPYPYDNNKIKSYSIITFFISLISVSSILLFISAFKRKYKKK